MLDYFYLLMTPCLIINSLKVWYLWPRKVDLTKLLKHYLQVKQLEDDLCEEMAAKGDKGYSSIAVALYADSHATWFLDAIQSLAIKEGVLLDIKVDDQKQTHRLLKDRDVVGCISTKDHSLQGCRIDYIGQMNYHMKAATEFAKK